MKWREDYKSMKVLSAYQTDLLENGPKSLAQSWVLQAMYVDWKRKTGNMEPEPPNCQSSYSELNKRIEEGLYDDANDPYGGH